VLIRVTDTGAGMPPDILERAFDPFFTTKEPGRGSGLGLSMVYGFALQSGGKVEISSAPERGTTVALWLPRAAAAAAAPEPVAAAIEPRFPEGGGRLLVCDDDEEVLASMIEALGEYGYGCLAVTSGEAALGAIERDETFDAIILDVAMPEMSGSAVAQAIRQRRPDLPILLVTGYMESASERGPGPPIPTLRKALHAARPRGRGGQADHRAPRGCGIRGRGGESVAFVRGGRQAKRSFA